MIENAYKFDTTLLKIPTIAYQANTAFINLISIINTKAYLTRTNI